MWKTRLGFWASIACIGALLNALAYFSHAQCTSGCVEYNCLKIGGQCIQTDRTDAVDDYYGDPDCGAVGGLAMNVKPKTQVNLYNVPSCSKECSYTRSRALNSEGKSTCAGMQTNPVQGDLQYCGSS